MKIQNVVEEFLDGLPAFAVLAVVLLILWLLQAPSMDPREPPLMKPTIPGSHALGFLWDKMKYFEKLSARYQLPIFTVPLFNSKLVVVTSPDAVQSCLRSKILSFDPFSITFATNVLGAKTNLAKELFVLPPNDREPCYTNDMHKIYHEPLQPGPELMQTNKNMLRRVSEFVNEIGPEYERKDLYRWLQTSFTLATARSLFGSRNPLERDHSLINALWDFEGGLQMLMLDFLPAITASKAHRGRAKFQAAMRSYFNAGYDLDDDVSSFIKKRSITQRGYGFEADDLGNFDIAMMMVATTNAIPTLYWYLVYVFSQPSLVDALRNEVLGTITTTTDSSSGIKSMTIDISKFSSTCPILCSSYQEAQRMANKSLSIRVALDDTTITSADGSYLIKKDTLVFLPSSLQHTNQAIWGPDAKSFNATRFLKRDMTISEGAKSLSANGGDDNDMTATPKAREAERIQKKAFFPFGGGKHLCPGRHFAFAEIVGFIGVMCVGFEMVMADDGGVVRVPDRHYRSFGEAVPKPVEQTKVLIRRRKEFEDVKWAFDVGSWEGK